MAYYVYILKCADNTLYTGSTNDIEKRVNVHNNLKQGARYTKSRRPVILVHSESFDSKSQALKREVFIKKLSRKDKVKILLSKDLI